MFIDGFLALCSAVSTGSCTEVSGSNYARQPIAFSVPKSGLAVSTKSFSFGFPSIPGPIAGRAIYDAPSGGNLLLIMPHASPRPIPGAGPIDAGDAGFLSIQLTALTGYADASAFSGSIAAGSVCGTAWDALDVLGPSSTTQGGNLVPSAINSSPLSSGVQLVINRGVLAAHGVFVS